MTLMGAIKQLHELRSSEDMPIYYKPVIAEVINVLLMDTQEVKHGRWIWKDYYSVPGDYYPEDVWECDLCGKAIIGKKENYCPNCGVKMDLDKVEE